MKPDPKKQRDKARLDRKKEAGRAARAARKEARAALQDPLRGPEAAALVEVLRHQRGERRRRAFDELAALDRGVAVALVVELLDDAAGQNREELGRLLASRGDPRHIDLVLSGRAGDVVIADVLDREAAVAAARRLTAEIPRLAPGDAADRLRRLGVAPLVDGVTDGIGARDTLATALTAALRHPRRGELAAATLDTLVDALLRVSPDALWLRCRDVLDERHRRDPRLQLAALAAGVDVDDLPGLLGWLGSLDDDERSRRLRDAGLPDSARRLPPVDAAALWRLCVLAGGLSASRREDAARRLWAGAGIDAAPTLLLHPDLAVDVTVALARALPFDEFWDAVAPTFMICGALRNALLTTPVARRPEVIEAMRAWLSADPLGYAAYAVRSEAPHAVEELLQAIERVSDDDDAGWLVVGALTTQTPSTVRSGRLPVVLSTILARTEGGEDVVAGLQVLRRFLPRAGAHAAEVDLAIERIVRRFALAR